MGRRLGCFCEGPVDDKVDQLITNVRVLQGLPYRTIYAPQWGSRLGWRNVGSSTRDSCQLCRVRSSSETTAPPENTGSTSVLDAPSLFRFFSLDAKFCVTINLIDIFFFPLQVIMLCSTPRVSSSSSFFFLFLSFRSIPQFLPCGFYISSYSTWAKSRNCRSGSICDLVFHHSLFCPVSCAASCTGDYIYRKDTHAVKRHLIESSSCMPTAKSVTVAIR